MDIFGSLSVYVLFSFDSARWSRSNLGNGKSSASFASTSSSVDGAPLGYDARPQLELVEQELAICFGLPRLNGWPRARRPSPRALHARAEFTAWRLSRSASINTPLRSTFCSTTDVGSSIVS